MRARRSTYATLALFAIAAAAGTGVPLACSSGANVAGSAGVGGSSHASSSHASSGHTGTGGSASSSHASSGGPGSGGSAATGGAGGTQGTGGASGAGGTQGTGGAAASVGVGGAGLDAATDAPMEQTVTLHPNAPPLPGQTSCTVVETTNIPEPDYQHLPVCTPITYATNPPSGGNHWPIWANYTQFTTPVPREMYVHDLEHGGIVLTYNCPNGCQDVVAALQMVFADQYDMGCVSLGQGAIARMVLTPDPELPTPIAASAWGATYTATCIDTPSLLQFVQDHYARAPVENFCNEGPYSVPDCADGGADGGDGG